MPPYFRVLYDIKDEEIIECGCGQFKTYEEAEQALIEKLKAKHIELTIERQRVLGKLLSIGGF